MDEYEKNQKAELPLDIQTKILELLPVLPPVGIHGKMNQYLLCQRVFERTHFPLTHDQLETFLSKYYDLKEWDRIRTENEQVMYSMDFELPIEMIKDQQEFIHHRDGSDYDIEDEEEEDVEDKEEFDADYSSGYSDYEECSTPSTATNKYHGDVLTGPIHSPAPHATRQFTRRNSISFKEYQPSPSPSTPSDRDLLSERRRYIKGQNTEILPVTGRKHRSGGLYRNTTNRKIFT